MRSTSRISHLPAARDRRHPAANDSRAGHKDFDLNSIFFTREADHAAGNNHDNADSITSSKSPREGLTATMI
jgi:hypothetical protein